MSVLDKLAAYELGQRVLLVQPNIPGIVQAIIFNMDGVQFQVSYWDDSIRRIEWCFANEMAPIQKQSAKAQA